MHVLNMEDNFHRKSSLLLSKCFHVGAYYNARNMWVAWRQVELSIHMIMPGNQLNTNTN